MSNELRILDERELLGKHFRVYGTIENPLFVAKDIAEWIEFDETSIGKMLSKVDKSEKLVGTIFLSGQNRDVWLLSEDGLYEVLMQSRKPLAKEFKKQVKSILKSIRKYGMYAKDELLNNPELLVDVAQKLIEEKNKVKQLEQENALLKPKAQLLDDITSTDDLYNFKQMADTLGQCGRNTLMKILRESNILSSNNYNKNLPYSQFEKQGLFKVKITPRKTNNGLENICTTLCTSKSIPFIKKVLNKKKDLQITQA